MFKYIKKKKLSAKKQNKNWKAKITKYFIIFLCLVCISFLIVIISMACQRPFMLKLISCTPIRGPVSVYQLPIIVSRLTPLPESIVYFIGHQLQCFPNNPLRSFDNQVTFPGIAHNYIVRIKYKSTFMNNAVQIQLTSLKLFAFILVSHSSAI